MLMIFGPSGHDHGPKNQIFLILDTAYCEKTDTGSNPNHFIWFWKSHPRKMLEHKHWFYNALKYTTPNIKEQHWFHIVLKRPDQKPLQL